MVLLKDIFQAIEKIAPSSLAMDWDSVGLQIGDCKKEATGILVALDPSVPAIKKAAENKFNLLLTHHPLFFSPLKNVDLKSPIGKIVKSAIDNDVAIFSAHTNLDCATGGINDMLAERIGLQSCEPIEACEEATKSTSGLGRIGTMKESYTLSEMAQMVKEQLKLDHVRILGDTKRIVKRIALCGGSGGDLINKSFKLGADVLITGDIRYHQAREAEDIGIALIDAGHFGSEKIAISGLAALLKSLLQKMSINIIVDEYKEEVEPLITL